MNKELMNLASWALETAKNAGAKDCEVTVGKERFVEVNYRKGKPETISEATKSGLSLEVFVDDRYSGSNISDLREKTLKPFIQNTVEAAKLLAEDKYRSLPDPKYYKDMTQKDLKIYDPSYEKYTPEKRHEAAKRMEQACMETKGVDIISVQSLVYDTFKESVKLGSNGFEGYNRSTEFWLGGEMNAKDKGDRRPNGWEYVAARNMEDLPSPEQVGKTAGLRTKKLLGAKKIKTMKLPVIVENKNVRRLFGGVSQALSGRNIHQKRSFLADKKGKKIANDLLTVKDDPWMVRAMGSRLYDSDGMAVKPMPVIENGVLKNFYIDWYYSRKLGVEPTTGGDSNLIIPPGKRSVAEIMKDLDKGVLITGFLGGNSNSTTGDFSLGIIGQLFEKGEPVQAIAEMNIAGNYSELFNQITEMANDPWMYGSSFFPSVVFDDIVIAGV